MKNLAFLLLSLAFYANVYGQNDNNDWIELLSRNEMISESQKLFFEKQPASLVDSAQNIFLNSKNSFIADFTDTLSLSGIPIFIKISKGIQAKFLPNVQMIIEIDFDTTKIHETKLSEKLSSTIIFEDIKYEVNNPSFFNRQDTTEIEILRSNIDACSMSNFHFFNYYFHDHWYNNERIYRIWESNAAEKSYYMKFKYKDFTNIKALLDKYTNLRIEDPIGASELKVVPHFNSKYLNVLINEARDLDFDIPQSNDSIITSIRKSIYTAYSDFYLLKNMMNKDLVAVLTSENEPEIDKKGIRLNPITEILNLLEKKSTGLLKLDSSENNFDECFGNPNCGSKILNSKFNIAGEWYSASWPILEKFYNSVAELKYGDPEYRIIAKELIIRINSAFQKAKNNHRFVLLSNSSLEQPETIFLLRSQEYYWINKKLKSIFWDPDVKILFSESENLDLFEILNLSHRVIAGLLDERERQKNLRIQKVNDFHEKGRINTGNDYFWAAMILLEARDTLVIDQSIDFITKAIELDTSIRKSFYPYFIDNSLKLRGKPQIYGTVYDDKIEGIPWKLYKIDTSIISDSQREYYDILPLEQIRLNEVKMNKKMLYDYYSETKSTDKTINLIKKEFSKGNESDYLVQESTINDFGYHLIRDYKYEEALIVFLINVEFYPNTYNTYDSLGECYLLMNEKELAINAYLRSLEINPNNENAKKVLRKLERTN
jgi:tetratricopeptide (TPR) repeat protein